MNNIIAKSTRCASVLASVLVSSLAAAEPLPPTDNQQPPYLAVWKEPKAQPQGIKEYNTWLNRKLVWADISPCCFYTAAKTWPEIELPFDKAWGKWVAEVPGRRVILSPFLLPNDGGVSKLAIGATGAYNEHWAALAKNLVESNLGNTIICMGPVSDWGAVGRVINKEDAANFALYWRQIVTTMRAVPGADKLQFNWVSPGGKPSAVTEAAYPGDAYVDYVGLMLQEGSGDRHIYPYPPFASDSEKLYHQKKAWDLVEYPALQTWSAFAKAHGKPFSIPRWGLTADHTRSEGFDAPYYIQAMHDYMQNPDNNVYFSVYFEYYHYSWLSPTNGYKTNEPKAAAAFHECFALP